MTDIEMPSWAKIIENEKAIKCPKCSHWMFASNKPSIWSCQNCNLKSYETKLEGYWIKKTAEYERLEKLNELGLAPAKCIFAQSAEFIMKQAQKLAICI